MFYRGTNGHFWVIFGEVVVQFEGLKVLKMTIFPMGLLFAKNTIFCWSLLGPFLFIFKTILGSAMVNVLFWKAKSAKSVHNSQGTFVRKGNK